MEVAKSEVADLIKPRSNLFCKPGCLYFTQSCIRALEKKEGDHGRCGCTMAGRLGKCATNLQIQW